MRERPILFSGPMVRAILSGAKTQTRRLRGLEQFNQAPDEWAVLRRLNRVEPLKNGGEMEFPGAHERSWLALKDAAGVDDMAYQPFSCLWAPGDLLWVRETWRHTSDKGGGPFLGGSFYYRSDEEWNVGAGWRPSIHMPRSASRLTLRITDVRVQRLQEISEDDAEAEGCGSGHNFGDGTARTGFAMLWDSINGKRAPWSSNPWVWALTFEAIR